MARQRYGGLAWWQCGVCGFTGDAGQHRHGAHHPPPTPAPEPAPERRAGWRLDTTPERQRRRALKRWHGSGCDAALADYRERNERIAVMVRMGVRQATVATLFRITQGRVSQGARSPEWADAELPPPGWLVS